MIFSQRIRRNAIKLDGEKSTSLDLARGRVVLLCGFFVLVYIVFAVRAFDLAIIQGQMPSGDNGAFTEVVSENDDAVHRRANITDRNGVLLAATLKTASLYVDAQLIANPEHTAKGLVKIFSDLSYGDVLQKLQSGKRFVWIKRNASPEQQHQVLKLGEPGLEFKYEYQRFYPQGPLAGHMVGYSDIDNHGLAGIERGFDNYLNEGRDLKLTLDVRFQHVLRREVMRALDDYKAIGATGVIMDAENGDVLGAVSLPDFNPHKPGEAKSQELFNRLTLGVYELGSVFKIFSTAAFFETHDVPMSTIFDASEPIKIGRFVINDYHAQDRILSVPEVFMYSSNIGSALMGQAVGDQGLKDFYTDLGLLSPLDFEVREVAQPMVPNPWREVNTLTAAYGHGVATTPLQMVSAVASIVNGGYLVKPKLVLEEKSDANKAGALPADIRVVSADTAQKMRQLLRLVVTEGTGSKAEVHGYRVGGKTGTADKIVNGKYDSNKRISSFVGVFPMDAPRYVIFVMLDEPKGTQSTHGFATAGWVAAPAVARIITAMVSILGIPPVAENTAENQFGASLKQYISAKAQE